jgi:starch-binding outer membrane protein, SusD/RagB family
MTIKHRHGAGARVRMGPGWFRLALVVLPVIALTGCDLDRLLEVEDPDVALPETVEGEAALPAVHAHAITEFAVAYVGNPATGTEGQILISGLLADEFIHSGTFDTRESIDRRIAEETNPHVGTTFRNLHRARIAGERATDLFTRFGPNTARHAEVMNLVGYTYLMLAENYCSGVPFSRIDDAGQSHFGEPETTTQVFQRAVAQFEAAQSVANTAGSVTQQNLARLGRGRALLGLGQYAAAAAAVADVPTDFEYVVWHSEGSARQNNGVWVLNNNGGRWSVPDREGENGLPFRSEGDLDGVVQDPRIPVGQVGLAQRSALRARGEHWAQLRYPERASPTILARGEEARLIEAEAALNRGNSGAYLPILNTLRADVGLGALSDPGTPAARVDQFFQERAYWMWLTSRRLGDLRRMMWDYDRTQDQIFPIGSHHRAGAPYGTDTNLPIPFDELNNPLSALCLTRDDAANPRHGS